MTFLQTREEWFAHLEDYRNALAHRIPPYIPPNCIAPSNIPRFEELDELIVQDVLAGNIAAKEEHVAEQDALKFFKPWMKHSFGENSPIGILHQQVVIDFLAVKEFAWRMKDQLDQLPAPTP